MIVGKTALDLIGTPLTLAGNKIGKIVEITTDIRGTTADVEIDQERGFV